MRRFYPTMRLPSRTVFSEGTTTLADLFTLLFAANPFSAARAWLRRWSSDELEDGLAHGGQCRSRRRPVDSELRISSPIGYAWDRNVGLGVDPDRRLQGGVRPVFHKIPGIGGAPHGPLGGGGPPPRGARRGQNSQSRRADPPLSCESAV